MHLGQVWTCAQAVGLFFELDVRDTEKMYIHGMVIVLMVPPFYQLVLTLYIWSLSTECSLLCF